jgi:hypothetical protein
MTPGRIDLGTAVCIRIAAPGDPAVRQVGGVVVDLALPGARETAFSALSCCPAQACRYLVQCDAGLILAREADMLVGSP